MYNCAPPFSCTACCCSNSLGCPLLRTSVGHASIPHLSCIYQVSIRSRYLSICRHRVLCEKTAYFQTTEINRERTHETSMAGASEAGKAPTYPHSHVLWASHVTRQQVGTGSETARNDPRRPYAKNLVGRNQFRRQTQMRAKQKLAVTLTVLGHVVEVFSSLMGVSTEAMRCQELGQETGGEKTRPVRLSQVGPRSGGHTGRSTERMVGRHLFWVSSLDAPSAAGQGRAK